MRARSLDAGSALRSDGTRGTFCNYTDGRGDYVGGAGAGGTVLVRTVDAADCTASARGGLGNGFLAVSNLGHGGEGRIFIQSRGGTCGVSPDAGVLEDAGASTFGCIDSGACPADKPVCDSLTRVCRACVGAECAKPDAAAPAATPDATAADVSTTTPPSTTTASPPQTANPPAADPELTVAGGGCRTSPSRGSPMSLLALSSACFAALLRRRRRLDA